jgi:hypothetical protein
MVTDNRPVIRFLRLLFIAFAMIVLSTPSRVNLALAQSPTPGPSIHLTPKASTSAPKAAGAAATAATSTPSEATSAPKAVTSVPKASPSAAQVAAPKANVSPSAEDALISFLNHVLDWYRLSQLPPEAPLDPTLKVLLLRAPETGLAVVKTAFDYARAYANMLERSAAVAASMTEQPPVSAPEDKESQQKGPTLEERFAERRAQLQEDVRQTTARIDRMKVDLAAAPAAQKAALQGQLKSLENQLRLDRAGLEFFERIKSFEQSETTPSKSGPRLLEKINEMATSVPALSMDQKTWAVAENAKSEMWASLPSPGSGIWGRTNVLFSLQKEKQRVNRLMDATTSLSHEYDELAKAMKVKARNLVQQMRQLAAEDLATSRFAVEQRSHQFDLLLAQLRSMTDVLAPIEAGRSLLRTYQRILRDYQARLGRESYRALQDLLQQALLLSVIFGFIFGGAVVWRRLALRYVLDPRRFHQLMVFRTLTVVFVSALVLMFKFATDLAALATVMGFAAAGIAFALQNVILSVVGYFSIIGRNGIRVGDRVGLQGPFGYVYGEIIELGVLRISLRELSSGADNWAPTGRTVVFPNSVVFTGSFLKLPRTSPIPRKPASL